MSVSRKWGTLLSVSLATLMLLIDFMAVSVALPAIRGSVGASLAQLQWVIEAFVLTLAAFVLTAGHIADLKGSRPVFLLGLVVFSVGSLLGWLAPTAIALIGARVVQGVGGALLFATGPVLLTAAFRDGRGRLALAVWGTLTGLAVALSPLVGGLITTYLGWRSISSSTCRSEPSPSWLAPSPSKRRPCPPAVPTSPRRHESDKAGTRAPAPA